MTDNMNGMEHSNNAEALRSRRAVLKLIAAAPLAVTFGLVTSPLMRYLKPTMQPGNFFQAADLPTLDKPVDFKWIDFPEIWSCIPFMVPMKYLVFNPEQHEVRKIPGFAIRVDKNTIVAYSRICPKQSSHILNYIRDINSCGCTTKKDKCFCIAERKNPVLYCPTDRSVFDLSDNGRVIAGPAPRPPRQFSVEHSGDLISIIGLEQLGIA